MSLVIPTCTCRPSHLTGKADQGWGFMDMGTIHGVPGCEGGHAVNVSRRRPGGLAWSQEATGNGSVSGQADIADGHVSSPQGLSYRWHRPGHLASGKEPSCSHWRSQACGMSDGLTARCSGLQTVSDGLANKGEFEPTFCANKLRLAPTITVNEPTFGSYALLVMCLQPNALN
jgi:hypothetical protein